MIPLAVVAAGAAAINPVLGIAVLTFGTGAVAFTWSVMHEPEPEPEPTPVEKPVTKPIPAPALVAQSVAQTVTQKKESAVAMIEKTALSVAQIATTTQQQKTNISTATTSLQQSTARLTQASQTIQVAANALETQTQTVQNNINETTRLRASLAVTNAALRSSQQTLAMRENEITYLTTRFRATHLSLQQNAAVNQATATDLLNRALQAQTELQSNLGSLLASKEAEIILLRQERAGLRAAIRTMDQALSARLNTTPNHAHRTPPTPLTQAQLLEAAGVFSANRQALDATENSNKSNPNIH